MYCRNDMKIFKPPQIWSKIAETIRYQENVTEEYDLVPDTGNDLLDEAAKYNEESNFVGRVLGGINSIISFKGRDTLILPNQINIFSDYNNEKNVSCQ